MRACHLYSIKCIMPYEVVQSDVDSIRGTRAAVDSVMGFLEILHICFDSACDHVCIK